MRTFQSQKNSGRAGIEHGVNQAADALIEYTGNNPECSEHSHKMLTLWRDGMESAEMVLSPDRGVASAPDAVVQPQEIYSDNNRLDY